MQSAIAVIAAEIPQAAALFFPRPKERPTEAPFGLLEKKRCNEELKRKARLAPKNENVLQEKQKNCDVLQ